MVRDVVENVEGNEAACVVCFVVKDVEDIEAGYASGRLGAWNLWYRICGEGCVQRCGRGCST